MEIIKQIKHFFKNTWGKIKPIIKKKLSFIAALLFSAAMIIVLTSLGFLLDIFLLGSLGGFFTVSCAISGIYFCVKNFSIFRRNFSFDNQSNVVVGNKLLDKLETETYSSELFTKKEVEF